MCISSRAPDCRTILQNWQDKTPKASLEKWSIMEHSPGLPQDTKFLRSCSGNRVKMLLKGHLWIKCHSQNNKVIRLLSIVPPIVNKSNWGCIVQDLETIIVLVLLAFSFIPKRSHHSLTLPRSWIRVTWIAGTQTFPISKLCGRKQTTLSINHPRQINTRRSNTWDNTDVMKIGR